MSFINSVLSMAASMGGDQKRQDQANVLNALLETANQFPGGLPALFEQLKQGGLGSVVKSWFSANAEPVAIESQQLEQALGPAVMGSLTTKTGLTQSVVLQYLVKLLPLLITTMVQKGVISENKIPEKLDSSSLMTTVLSLLTKAK